MKERKIGRMNLWSEREKECKDKRASQEIPPF
jgi:hypothetical protein